MISFGINTTLFLLGIVVALLAVYIVAGIVAFFMWCNLKKKEKAVKELENAEGPVLQKKREAAVAR